MTIKLWLQIHRYLWRYFWMQFKNEFEIAWEENILGRTDVPKIRRFMMPCIVSWLWDKDGNWIDHSKDPSLAEIMMVEPMATNHADLDDKFTFLESTSGTSSGEDTDSEDLFRHEKRPNMPAHNVGYGSETMLPEIRSRFPRSEDNPCCRPTT